MSIVDREPRELYRVYDEEEFLSADGPSPRPGDDPFEQPAPYGHDRHLQDPEPRRPPLPRRGPRARPVAMLLGAGLGVLVVVALHLHATAGRPARPLQQRRPILPAVQSRRPAPRARRAQAVAPRVEPARTRAGTKGRSVAAARGIVPAVPAASVVTAPAASHRSSREFGFER